MTPIATILQQNFKYQILNSLFLYEEIALKYLINLIHVFTGVCPHSYDTLTVADTPSRRRVRLETGLQGGYLIGKLTFSFAGSSVTMNADARSVSSASCTTALSTLKSATNISCSREFMDEATGRGSYIITLNNYPEQPHFNNLVTHNGNPDISMFTCDSSKIDAEEAQAPYCLVSNIEDEGVDAGGSALPGNLRLVDQFI